MRRLFPAMLMTMALACAVVMMPWFTTGFIARMGVLAVVTLAVILRRWRREQRPSWRRISGAGALVVLVGLFLHHNLMYQAPYSVTYLYDSERRETEWANLRFLPRLRECSVLSRGPTVAMLELHWDWAMLRPADRIAVSYRSEETRFSATIRYALKGRASPARSAQLNAVKRAALDANGNAEQFRRALPPGWEVVSLRQP